MSIKVTTKTNEKVLLALKEIPAKLKNLHVRIGVPDGVVAEDSEHKPTGTKLWKVAAAHEFGVPGHLPERRPLRGALKWGEKELAKRASLDLKKVVNGSMDPHTMMESLGLKASGMVAEYISGPGQQEMEPIQQSTIDRKGSSWTLIDSGQLRQSYKHEVRND